MLANVRRAARLCLLLVISACGEEPGPHGADGANCPNSPAGLTSTLSGVITERFSGRPVPGAKVWVWPISFAQVPSWPPTGLRRRPRPRRTYIISGLPFLGPVWVSTSQTWGNAFSAPYVHQCATTVTVEGDATLDLTVSSMIDSLRSTRPRVQPDQFAKRLWHGVRKHLKRPAAGRKRLGGVGSDSDRATLMAETITDAAGQYRVCGCRGTNLPTAAPANGNVFYSVVDPGSDAIVDIEIVRK